MSNNNRPTQKQPPQPAVNPQRRGGGHHAQFAEVQHAAAPLKTVIRLLSYLKSQRKTVLLLFIPVAVSVTASLVGPKILGQIIDTIEKAGQNELGETYRTIGILIFYSATAFLIQQLCALIQGYTTNLLSNRTVKQLRTDLFGHVLDFQVSEFTETTHGEFMSRLTNDVDMVAQNLNNSLATLVTSITLFIGSVLMMFITNWIMALTAIFSSIVGFLLMVKISQRTCRSAEMLCRK